MIKSMTGYGASRHEEKGIRIFAEVKSLNSKSLDVMIKLPREFAEREMELKSVLGDILERGKVSLTVEYESHAGDESSVINEEVFMRYYKSLLALKEKTGEQSAGAFDMALQFPEVAVPQEHLPTEDEWQLVYAQIKKSIDACDRHRIEEGNKLKPDLMKNVKEIGRKLDHVEKEDPKRIENIKNRVKNNLREHLTADNVDSNRFEQELIYYLEKLDINEEKVRLRSHLKYFLEVLESPQSRGKKLGFIVQEIGREINTIGSKANHAAIQHLVVEMKEEMEKIREQLLNIL